MNLKDVITPFKVGLVVLASIAATIYMVMELSGGAGLGGDDGYKVYGMIEDVTGLAKDSRVMIAGIPVGSIDDIQLVGDKARVDIRVREGIELYRGVPTGEDYYKNGATLIKKQAGFIGDFFLEITPGEEGPLLQDGEEIRNVRAPTDFDEIFARMNDITKDINSLTTSLAETFGSEEGQQTLQRMLQNLDNLVQTLDQFANENSQKLDRVLTNAEVISQDVRRLSRVGTESIEDMLQDAQAVVQEVRFIIGQSSGDVQAGLGTLRGTLARLQSTLDSLNYSLQNIQDITDKINEGEGTVGQLVNDPTIAERTESILAEADKFAGSVGRLRTIVELRSEYHWRHQQFKTVFGLRLQPEEYKYYLVEFIDDYRGNTDIVTETINTTDAEALDASFRETRTTTTDEFKFSLQIARGMELTPWAKVFGRFGLIESTGGVGGNLILFRDESLEIETDVYDFGVDVRPRWRAFANYKFFEYFYVIGGIDDTFNSDDRDYFLGAGIQFDDEDLKAIISTTGVPTSP